MNSAKLLTEFLQRPLAVGTILPSSRYLARLMVQQAGLADADVVLEYGAGTGAITGHILGEMSSRARFAAIEINPQLAAVFRAAHPGVPVFEDSVENVRAICDSMDVAMVDCIISGLPWALFPKSTQVTILDQMMRVLKPGGRFVAFGYPQSLVLPAARHLATLLPTYFTVVSKSTIVWRNVPPAFIYRCRR